MKGLVKFSKNVSALIILLLTVSLNSTVYAASCKGKSKSSCSANSDCSWVSAYKRSDGTKVKAHCRAVSGKGSSSKAAKSSSKSKDKKKSDKKSKDKKSKDKKSKDKKSKDKKSKDKKSKDKKFKDKKKSKDKKS